jgi:hypothetical protein
VYAGFQGKESSVTRPTSRAARRSILGWLAVALVAPIAAFAQSGKARKQDMKYQDRPQKGQKCEDCIHYIPAKDAKAPGECKIVEGPISPKGWCIEFQPKKKG